MSTPKAPRLYTPAEVAQRFNVTAKTVTRWAKTGKLPAATKTIGGHRRWNADAIDAMVRGES